MPSEVLLDLTADGVPSWDTESISKHTAAFALGTAGSAVRGGVVPATGDPLKYVATAGLTGTVKSGRYAMPLSSGLYGAYPLWLPSDTVLTHDAADATNPRTDLIIAELALTGIQATSFGKIRVLKGIASAGAPVPSTNWITPGGSAVDLGVGRWVSLASVNIPAAPNAALGAITDQRVSIGSPVVPVNGAFATPSLAATLPTDTAVWDVTAKKILVRDGASGLIEPISSGSKRDIGEWTASVEILAGATSDQGALTLTGNSYSPSVTHSGSFLYLPSNCVVSIHARFYMAGGLENTDFTLVRTSDLQTLASTRSVGPTGPHWYVSHPNVLSSVHPILTCRITNNSAVTKTFTTTITAAVVQRGL